MSYTKVKAINEESVVGYDQNGNIILAERLSKWAFNQLSSAPDLLDACKEIKNCLLPMWGDDVLEGSINITLSEDVINQVLRAISKAEGREGK